VEIINVHGKGYKLVITDKEEKSWRTDCYGNIQEKVGTKCPPLLFQMQRSI
jgi:hypothetical protein